MGLPRSPLSPLAPTIPLPTPFTRPIGLESPPPCADHAGYMPEAPDKQNALEAQAAALISNAPAEIDLDALAAEAVEGLVSDAQPAAAAPAPPETPPAATSIDMADLADAVQKLIDNAPQPAPAEPPLPADTKIETLDAHIAELADDLIAGEFADEQNQIKGQVGAPPPAPPPETPTVAPQAPAPQAPEPAAAHTPDIPVAPKPMKPAPAAKPPKPVEAPAEPKVETPRRALGERVKPIFAATLAALSAPLRNASKQTRDRVGWIAIITIFNATCLWGYLLFFRAPSTTVKAVSHDGDAKPADGHGDSHAKDPHAKESADSHGKASSAKDSHAKDSHAKDAHGAAKPTAKKTASKKPAPKKSGKKEAAQASHGGH